MQKVPEQKKQLSGQLEVQVVLSELRVYPLVQAEQVVKERQVLQWSMMQKD